MVGLTQWAAPISELQANTQAAISMLAAHIEALPFAGAFVIAHPANRLANTGQHVAPSGQNLMP